MNLTYRAVLHNVNAAETDHVINHVGGICIHRSPAFYQYRLHTVHIDLAQHGPQWTMIITADSPDNALNGLARLGYATNNLTLDTLLRA